MPALRPPALAEYSLQGAPIGAYPPNSNVGDSHQNQQMLVVLLMYSKFAQAAIARKRRSLCRKFGPRSATPVFVLKIVDDGLSVCLSNDCQSDNGTIVIAAASVDGRVAVGSGRHFVAKIV